MPLPERQYFSLCNLASRWGVKKGDIKYYVEHGELATCCWLDLREIMRYQPRQESCKITCEYMSFEGYVGLTPRDCRKVFRCGKYKLTSFFDLEDSSFEIALAPKSRDALISVADIVVSKEECLRFEELNGLHVSDHCAIPCRASMIGRLDINASGIAMVGANGLFINRRKQEYYFKGQLLHLGPIQSNIIDQLALAHATHVPWIHGKTLLHHAGSQAVRMRDVFKTQATWRDLVQSDKRGHYRIFEGIEVNVA